MILKPGVPMQERLEEAARVWTKSGRDPTTLLNGTAFFLAQCWMRWNAILRERDWCSQCHMSFHLENLGMCTECLEYVCGACNEAHGKKCAGEVVG